MSRLARVLWAGASYFALVFVLAFALGAARTLLLEPHMSKLAATAVEAPFLLMVMIAAARWVPPRFHLAGDGAALWAIGLIGLGLQQGADIALGMTLRGLSLAEQYAQFLRPEGWLFAALLIVFAAAPWAFHRKAR